jgi:hypothetical protein
MADRNSKIMRRGLSNPKKAIEAAQETIDIFDRYDGADFAQWATDSAGDVEFVNNVQWKIEVANALEADNQPVVVNNEIKPARDQVVGQLTQNSPRWIAVGRENSDVKMAGYISDLMSYIWDESNGRMHFRTAVEDFEDTGLFIFHTYYDPYGDNGKGEIRVVRINPQLWRCDPQTDWRNAQNADNQFLTDVLSKEKIEQMYPDFNFDGATEWVGDMKRYGKGAIRDGQVFHPLFTPNVHYYRLIDRYQRVKVQMFWVFDPNSSFEKILDKAEYIKFAQQPAAILVRQGQEKAVVDELELQQVFQILNQYGSIYHQMSDGSLQSGLAELNGAQMTNTGQVIFPVPNSSTQIHIVKMMQLLHEGKLQWQINMVDRIKRSIVIGEKLYKQMLMPISNYPFGVTMLHHTGNPFPYGDARITKSIQEQINKISSIIIAYNINISALRAFIQKQSMDTKDLEKRWGKAGAQFFEYDSDLGSPPVIIQLTQMSTSFFQQLDRLRNLIQRIYGAYDFQEGLGQQMPNTASATMQMDEAGQRRSASKLLLLEDALNDVASVVAEMIPQVYTERKLIHVLAPNSAKSRQVVFNQEVVDGEITRITNNLMDNHYDIKMVSASTLPTNRAARLGFYMDMYRNQVIKNPTPILRLSDLPDIEEVIENEDLLKQAEVQMQQMQQSIKQLSGDLQTASREKVHSDQKVLLAKFKTQLDKIAIDMAGSVLVGKQRINDKVKEFKGKADEALSTINENSEPTGTQE